MRTKALLLACSVFIGCGDDSSKQCSLTDPSTCDNGLVCETITDMSGMHNACVAPTLLHGKITDAVTNMPVAGARVVALDADDHAATGPVAISDAQGNYSLRVVAPRMSGAMKDYTLRVGAQGYEDFPSGIRVALPITVAFQDPAKAATITGPEDVALIPIANAPTGAIAGRVSGDRHAGVLVVAEGGGKGFSTVTDSGGDYVVFNIPAGTYTVKGYFIGVTYAPAMNVAVASAKVDGVNLNQTGVAAGVLTGTLDYVAGAPGNPTAVVLRLQSTREVPPGFQAAAMNATPYRLEGVPDGTYDVLAAFPNDGLVKDPDPGIAGTGTPTVTFQGGNRVDAGTFKITDPVGMMGPDADAPVTGNPTFTWTAYPSAAKYTVVVYDSQGNQIYTADAAAGATSLAYSGNPALVAGEYYQWRITAFRQVGGNYLPTSISEDLRGVWQEK